MKCEIIKDLIPLCLDELCSDESKAEIEEHIKGCDNCRLLYESAPQTKDVSEKAPDEGKAFRKVNKKIKRSKLKIAILSLLLIAILCPLGYLTYGQIVKDYGCQSFETVIRSLEVRKIAKAIAYGDAETYVDSLSTKYADSLYMSQGSSYNELREQNIQHINDAYERFIQGKEVESIKVRSNYAQIYFSNSTEIYTEAEIMFKNCSDVMTIDFVKDIDGGYYSFSGINYAYNEGNTDYNMYFNAIAYPNNHEVLFPRGFFERLLRSDSEERFDRLIVRFNADYREKVKSSLMDYSEKGFEITDAILSPTKYDNEKKQCYYDITVTGADSKGTAVMTTRLYHDYLGLYPPEPDTINIYANGCTEELEASLAELFG